jgi:23S rRNA (adenine2503-C2)-methyltransferase
MWENVKEFKSSDNNVSKFVFTCKSAVAEAVLYKYPTYEERTVICCSTQSGCPVGCIFCGTGKKFIRNLTFDEIVYQCEYILNSLNIDAINIKKLQLMFMSMGEPFLNMKEVSRAIQILNVKYPNAQLLISTSAPKIDNSIYDEFITLSKKIDKIGLQFSVHESTDENRRKLIPSKTSCLKEISDIGIEWFNSTGRHPFFNYCVHKANNTKKDVANLLSLFPPNIFESTISVICEKDETIAASIDRQKQMAQDFSALMLAVGYNVRVFNPSGQEDIGGGCGQLWFVQKWIKEHKNIS